MQQREINKMIFNIKLNKKELSDVVKSVWEHSNSKVKDKKKKDWTAEDIRLIALLEKIEGILISRSKKDG
jgi:hypothetical protein